MSMLELTASIVALAFLVLPLTQLLKLQLGLSGRVVLIVSVMIGAALGPLLAVGGLTEFARLPNYPLWASGLVIGVLAGLVASGGKDAVTGIQITGAQARAEALVKAQAEVLVPQITPPSEMQVTATTAPAAPAPPPDEWVPASLDDLTVSRRT